MAVVIMYWIGVWLSVSFHYHTKKAYYAARKARHAKEGNVRAAWMYQYDGYDTFENIVYSVLWPLYLLARLFEIIIIDTGIWKLPIFPYFMMRWFLTRSKDITANDVVKAQREKLNESLERINLLVKERDNFSTGLKRCTDYSNKKREELQRLKDSFQHKEDMLQRSIEAQKELQEKLHNSSPFESIILPPDSITFTDNETGEVMTPEQFATRNGKRQGELLNTIKLLRQESLEKIDKLKDDNAILEQFNRSQAVQVHAAEARADQMCKEAKEQLTKAADYEKRLMWHTDKFTEREQVIENYDKTIAGLKQTIKDNQKILDMTRLETKKVEEDLSEAVVEKLKHKKWFFNIQEDLGRAMHVIGAAFKQLDSYQRAEFMALIENVKYPEKFMKELRKIESRV